MDTDSSSDEEEQEAQPVRIPLGHRPVVFGLPGAEELVERTIKHLGWQPGLCSFEVHGNGEIAPKVEETVANHDVFVIASRDDTRSEINFSLMRLMIFISALRGESPYRLTVILPCLEYARQDRKMEAGQGIAARLMLRCLKTAGADRCLILDLHNEAQVAFTPGNAVLDELCARKYLAHSVRFALGEPLPEGTLVCATNGGGTNMTRRMAAELCTGIMMVDRIRPKAGGKGDLKIMSSEPPDRIQSVVIVDDIFDTCGSLAEVCKALHAFAPRAKLYAVASHGYFSSNAHSVIKELVDSYHLQWLAVTNTVSQRGALKRFASVGLEDRLRVVDITRLLAGAMMRIYLGASVNLPKFREIGPETHDPVLQGAGSPRIGLARRLTEEGQPEPAPQLRV